MANIKRPIQIFNGTAWDKILPEISEDMIKSGWTQSLGAYGGYKKMPGGLIIQWGSVNTGDMASLASGLYGKVINFPITFSTAPVVSVGFNFDAGIDKSGVGVVTKTSARIQSAVKLANCNISWIAMGY